MKLPVKACDPSSDLCTVSVGRGKNGPPSTAVRLQLGKSRVYLGNLNPASLWPVPDGQV